MDRAAELHAGRGVVLHAARHLRDHAALQADRARADDTRARREAAERGRRGSARARVEPALLILRAGDLPARPDGDGLDVPDDLQRQPLDVRRLRDVADADLRGDDLLLRLADPRDLRIFLD